MIRQKLKASGIVLLELDRLSNAAEANRVEAVIAQFQDRLAGHLCVIEVHRIRLRPLGE